ncbi:hypothetical protein [Clostridium thailandense]|uniref:hypothetical protein n=1 Tax=Clostridium thailandense TaxID=2794346 RepID=UPI0035E40058
MDINKPAINVYLKNGFKQVDGIYEEELTLKCVKANIDAFKFYLSQGWTIEEEVTENELYYLMKYEG